MSDDIDRTPMHDKTTSFGTAPGGDLIIQHQQFIPDEFLSDLRKERMDSISTPAGDFHRVASIPVGVVEDMQREGLDIYRAPIEDILRWLRKRDIDGFITSNKL